MILLIVAAVMYGASAAFPGSGVYRADPYTMHDPGFPVRVTVAPSQDALWVPSNEDQDVLHVSSSVLDVSVTFPEWINSDGALVTMSFFESNGSTTSEPAAFDMFVDSQLQYVRKYRVELDPDKAGNRFVLRVYVEVPVSRLNVTEVGKASSKLRAFYVRWVDLSVSEPKFVSCGDQDDTLGEDAGARVSASPPANMPMDLCKRYTMDGRVPVRKWYFDDQTGADRAYGKEFSRETIDKFVEDASHSPADRFVHAGLEKYPLTGKRVLIMGSSGRPWVESICLAQKAVSCTTVARNRLHYSHPDLQTFTTAEFQDAGVESAADERFDVIIAAVALASEGLGRAGDPLDPDGDLKVMHELRELATPLCEPGRATSDGSIVMVVVPVGPDTVVWNAHRQYGPLRLPQLLQDWQVLDSYGFSQSDFTTPFNASHTPLFVLQPPLSCAHGSTDSTGRDEL